MRITKGVVIYVMKVDSDGRDISQVTGIDSRFLKSMIAEHGINNKLRIPLGNSLVLTVSEYEERETWSLKTAMLRAKKFWRNYQNLRKLRAWERIRYSSTTKEEKVNESTLKPSRELLSPMHDDKPSGLPKQVGSEGDTTSKESFDSVMHYYSGGKNL